METFHYLCRREKFEIMFLEPADCFLEEIGTKAKDKLLYNIKRAKDTNDPAAFKKLDPSLWEFRARAGGKNRCRGGKKQLSRGTRRRARAGFARCV